MSERLDELKHEVTQLSESERAELALILIESLEPLGDFGDADEAWRAEITRRSAEIARGEVQPVPGDDVFARLRQQLG